MRKTKVCIDCGKRKKLRFFPKQVQPKYNCKRGYHKVYSSDGHRNDCKECHQRKTIKLYHARTTAENRRVYMRDYRKKNKEINGPSWKPVKIQVWSFQLDGQPELIHIVKTGFKDTYYVIHESHGLCSKMKVESYSKKQIKKTFNIDLDESTS